MDFDLIVIGAGPGGYVAAIRGAQLGLKVACVEKDKTLGGTCSNVGCIPSKALLDSSEHFHLAKHSFAKHGIKVSGLELDLKTMLARKDEVVASNVKGIAFLLKKNKVEWLNGTAKLLGGGKVEVSGKAYSAKFILIATGSEPIPLPGAPFDGKQIVSSTEALTFDSVPKKMLVVGGGVIGLELGSVWARLGAEVIVVEMLDKIAGGMDAEMTKLLQRSLEKQGFKFLLKHKTESLKVDKGKVRYKLSGPDGAVEGEADRALVSIGRRAYTKDLGLDKAGVKLDDRGRITVDKHYQTSAPGVYAIGDVIIGPMLAHKASEEGVAAVERMVGKAGHVNYDAVPGVVYTNPELASVGMTEEELKAKNIEYRVGKFPFSASGRARAMGETEGQVKVLADKKTDRILGVHILGVRASDLIAEAVVAVELMGSVEDLARAVAAHPTLAEPLKEAALGAEGRAIHL